MLKDWALRVSSAIVALQDSAVNSWFTGLEGQPRPSTHSVAMGDGGEEVSSPFLPHPYSLSFTVLIHLSRCLSCRSFLFLPSFLDNPLSCYYHSESYHQITVKSNPRERWTVMKIEIITTNELAFSVSVCLHANDPFISVASLTGLPLLVMWLKCVLSKGCRPRCTGSSNGEKERNHKQEL